MDSLLKFFDESFLRRSLNDKKSLESFGRFLSAFFVDFDLVVNEDGSVPNLFRLSENDWDEATGSKANRIQIASQLPPNYNPAMAVELLCKCDLWLESALFSDSFADLRSALIIRRLIDVQFGLSLFGDHCDSVLITQMITEFGILSTNLSKEVLEERLDKLVNGVTQISVLFDYSIGFKFTKAIVSTINSLIVNLSPKVEDSIALPRPPIFVSSTDPLYDENFPDELQSWNRIHFLLRIFVLFLKRTNRLRSVCRNITSQLLSSADDIVDLLSDSEDIEEEWTEDFGSLMILVLFLDIRDRFSMAFRNGDFEMTNLLETEMNELLGKEFRLWKEEATDENIERIMMFVRFADGDESHRERFLPPLSSVTVEKWRSLFLSQNRRFGLGDPTEIPIFEDRQKPQISEYDFICLEFLFENFPAISLSDPSLIPIALRIRPSSLCTSKLPQMETTSSVETTNFIDGHLELRNRIAQTLQRLGQSELSNRTKSLRSLPRLVDSFHSHSSEPIISAKELPNAAAEPFSAKSSKQSDNLSEELRAISARLAKMRERWEEATDRRPPSPLTTSSSPTLPSPIKRKTKRRKRRPANRPPSQSSTSQEREIQSQKKEKEEISQQAERQREVEVTETQRLESSADSDIQQTHSVSKRSQKENIQNEEKRKEESEIISLRFSEGKKEKTIPNEKVEVDIMYVEPSFPTPPTPKSVLPLDFSQLSDQDEIPERLQWSEVSILERPRPTTAPKTQKPLPDWLHLVPFDERPRSSRLLTLNSQTPKLKTPKPRWDSGFVEISDRRDFGMNSDEIRSLIQQCDQFEKK